MIARRLKPVLAVATRFAKSRAGNVAVTFALSLAPLTAGVGGAVDYTRAVTLGSEIQNALDSGVLAAASLTQTREPEAVVRSYVEAALSDHQELIAGLSVTVTAETNVNAREVQAEARVVMPTVLLGLAGINTFTITRTSEAIEEVRNIEISLVLDISSSMGGNRIDSLRDAAIEFVETVLDGDTEDLTSISVVPYGGTVKLDQTFYRFITSDPTYAPDGLNYEIPVPDADDWNGCIELYGDEVAEMELTPGGHGVIPQFTVWHPGNDWCPDFNGAQSVFLSNDVGQLTGLIGNFDNPILSDGTGTDIAIGWGMRALDPSWRGGLNGGGAFTDRPAPFDDDETMKVLVVMTDGGITQQRRPEDEFEDFEDDPHVGTGGTDDLYNKNTARSNFLSVCDYAKDNGVQVYSIAFQVNGSSNRQLMEDCASRQANYYEISDLDIAAAFSAIAADLEALRLAR